MRYKLITAGVGLVGYGALVGWAVTADHLEAKMKSNQQLLAEIIKKKEETIQYLNSTMPGYVAKDVASTLALYPTVDDEKPSVDEELRGETPEETRANLQGLIDKYTENPEDVEAFTHMAGRVMDDGPDNTPPFVISKEIYSWDEEGEDYAKNTLTYFPRDRILLDEDEDVIDNKDIDSTVGWKNLDRFGDESDDADVVFVRTRRLLTDFEVVRDTENPPPAHIRYGMDRQQFESNKAAGLIKFRRGDVGD